VERGREKVDGEVEKKREEILTLIPPVEAEKELRI